MLLKLPYADGEPPDKQRTFLIINIANEVVEMLNVSSVKGKERKLQLQSNEILQKYWPPFCKPSFVKLDSLYRIELFDELSYLILASGKSLDPQEFNRIVTIFQVYRNNNQIKICFYNKADIERYNSVYIAERISATAEDFN
ncbi:hypothetical protein [Thermosediminibacter litoriperuensis]|nr:hypothetical protein [Thermosediminibacter litoriperuensis]